MSINLKKFDMSKVGKDRVILFVGKRNTGKSVLSLDMLYHQRNNIPVAVVVSGTEEGNGTYKKYVPDLMVYSDYDQEILERVITRQKKMLKRLNAATTAQERERINPHVLVLLDDCMFDKSIMKSKVMRYLVMNGRHLKLSLSLTCQYAIDIGPDIRANIDFIFVLRENITANREKLYKNFFGIFSDFNEFCTVLDACTSNFECLVLDNTSRSNKIEDCVFWYKADLHPDFKFGHPSFWKISSEKLNPDYEEEVLDQFSSKPKGKRVSRPRVEVNKEH